MARLTTDQTIGNYRVVRLLGEGGMGAVYEVLHTTLDRRAALKVLHADTASDPQLAARFLLEAKAASRVHHPGVVHIYEFGQTDDRILYFVMEYLDGESLSSRLRRAAKSPAGRLGLACLLPLQQVARALASVHKLGLVHRDLKPGNVMIVPDVDVPGGERAKVLDFGIVKSVAQSDNPMTAPVPEVRTRTGLLMGTPQYMAPEQWRGQKLDAKADVYALGIIAFEALAGQLPFVAEELPAMGMLHCFNRPPALAAIDPSLPSPLIELVERMLEKEPALRPTMTEVADRLGIVLGLPLESGSHLAMQPAAMPAPQPAALVDAKPRASDAPPAGSAPVPALAPAKPTHNAPASAVAPAASVTKSATQPAPDSPAANVPVEITAVPTAPMGAPPSTTPEHTAAATAPTLDPAARRTFWVGLMLVLAAVSTVGLWAASHDWRSKTSPTVLADFGQPIDLRAPASPVDLSAAPDLSSPPDLARPADLSPGRARTRCLPRRADSCILTPMNSMERDALRAALADNEGVYLCSGERLVIVGLPRKPRLLDAPSALKGESLDLFLNALRGLPSEGNFPVRVEIQCAK